MLSDIIETARLRLRPFRLHDVEAVLSYATDPEWAQYLPVPQPYLREHAEQFVASQVLLDRERHPAWAIEHLGVMSGGINIRFDFANRVGELGYSIARSYWGQGLVTEAAQAVLDVAFVACSDLQRIRAMADARNTGSLRVMEKIGMLREGILRQNRITRGESIDEAWCGILRSEWEARRK
jgi:[ribosomal protein S5]-alanine N-acetyltransferase